MKTTYSIHAQGKFEFPEIKKLGITKRDAEQVVASPDKIDRTQKPVLIAIGKLNEVLSLCVVYKKIKEGRKIITFFPAEKGRYERKVL